MIKINIGILTALVVFLFGMQGMNNANAKGSEVEVKIERLTHSIKTNATDIEILRRDQINYRTEKEMLKEAYESNSRRVDHVITVIFGGLTLAFAVVGYVGIRSISELRKNYTNELKEVRELRRTLEIEIDALRSKQLQAEAKIANLIESDKAQDGRVKLLELTEKVNQLVHAKNYEWAIEHLKVGLGIDPDYAPLLYYEPYCYYKLGMIDKAVAGYRREIGRSPSDMEAIQNGIELFVAAKRFDDYKEVLQKHKTVIEQSFNGNLMPYLNTLYAIRMDNLPSAKAAAKPLVEFENAGSVKPLEGWSFEDINFIYDDMPDLEMKQFAKNFIAYMNMALSLDEMKKLINH